MFIESADSSSECPIYAGNFSNKVGFWDGSGGATFNGKITADSTTISGAMNSSSINTGDISSTGNLTFSLADTGVHFSDGSVLSSAYLRNVYMFTSSGTWIAPTGVTWIKLRLLGGGGAGGSVTGTYQSCGGGGAGGYVEGYTQVVPGNSYTYAIGAGGANGNGGDTTFGSMLAGGGGMGSLSGGGGGGSASGGDLNVPGASGYTPISYSSFQVSTAGADSFSLWGQGGAPAEVSTASGYCGVPGNGASGYGAGGSGGVQGGCVSSGPGGNGAAGFVIIEY